MNITLVVAASDNNAIGKENKLLWHLPKDMRFFKNTTWGMPILMGRKTFESIGNKPLEGRLNLVLTRQKELQLQGAIAVSSFQEAVDVASTQDYKELLVIGGGEIYKAALPLANKIWLTRVHVDIEGDTFFPALDEAWEIVNQISYPADEKHLYSFDIECWQRK